MRYSDRTLGRYKRDGRGLMAPGNRLHSRLFIKITGAKV